MNYIKSFNGWFGELANDFTYDSVDSIVDTMSNYYKKNSSPGQKLVISYDTRFLAKEFAEYIARTMAKKGIKVFLSNRPSPSSVSVTAAIHKKSLGTVVITGDEYNAKYLGIRAYDMKGYSLTDKDLETYQSEGFTKPKSSLKEYMKKGVIELFDTSIVYELFVHKYIDFKKMTPTINQLLFNPYYGSGMYYFDYILMNQKMINGVTIHSERISDFKSNEPNPKQLYKQMFSEMVAEKTELGFIVSPDCTSFEFLVGNEPLSKTEILYYLCELLSTDDKVLNVLLSDENEVELERIDEKKVKLDICSEKDFYEQLKTEKYDMGMDAFEHFFFGNHGVPDALLCGFYLFLFFNQRERVSENASLFLSKMRDK